MFGFALTISVNLVTFLVSERRKIMKVKMLKNRRLPSKSRKVL